MSKSFSLKIFKTKTGKTCILYMLEIYHGYVEGFIDSADFKRRLLLQM